jgi:hypothetical protein
VGELAMGAVDLTPLLGDREDHVDLQGHQGVHGDPARCPVLQRADLPQPGPPAVNAVVGHIEQPARPGVWGAGSDRLVDQLEDCFLRLTRDPRRQRATQIQPTFPRSNAGSIACALTASVNCASSPRAASSSQLRSAAGRPGLADSATNAASFTLRRIPMIVDTSTRRHATCAPLRLA